MSERAPTSQHDYRRAREESREALREACVDAAIELLEEGGPEAVTVRRVAAMVGASTQIVYTLFGGKPGLAGAVFGRGHELLREALVELPRSDDVRADFREQGRAYRRRALASPRLYQVMFGDSLGELEPDERAMAAAAASFETLVASVRRCQEAGVLREGDPVELARIVFLACHGASSLELTGRRAAELDTDALYEQVLDMLIDGLAPRD